VRSLVNLVLEEFNLVIVQPYCPSVSIYEDIFISGSTPLFVASNLQWAPRRIAKPELASGTSSTFSNPHI